MEQSHGIAEPVGGLCRGEDSDHRAGGCGQLDRHQDHHEIGGPDDLESDDDVKHYVEQEYAQHDQHGRGQIVEKNLGKAFHDPVFPPFASLYPSPRTVRSHAG